MKIYEYDFGHKFIQLNKANTSDTVTPFLDLHLSISNGFGQTIVFT